MNDKKLATSNYRRGVKNGIPICLGYLPIAFAFGVTVVNKAFPKWAGMLMAMTNFTATAQFAALDAIISGAIFTGVVTRVFIINIRYILMSMSLAQRLEPNLSVFKKCVLSFFQVDEVFAIAMQEEGNIPWSYFMGLVTLPYISWGVGTFLGIIIGGILPHSLSVAFEIVLYAMFAAILIPSAKKSKPIAFTIILSIIIDCLLQLVPGVKNWKESVLIIIAAGIASCITALKYPVNVDEDEEVDKGSETKIESNIEEKEEELV